MKLRTRVTKGAGSKTAALAMAYKLAHRAGALAAVQGPRADHRGATPSDNQGRCERQDDEPTTRDEEVGASDFSCARFTTLDDCSLSVRRADCSRALHDLARIRPG